MISAFVVVSFFGRCLEEGVIVTEVVPVAFGISGDVGVCVIAAVWTRGQFKTCEYSSVYE